MSVWNPDNIKDVAESVGISNLSNEVTDNLSRDVEYRVAQVLEEALRFMRHSKRTVLTTQDISQALRILDVEPLYGYESTRPLRFGEASIGPGQPLFYVEDEEVDFEKLINAPLPKVPRDISFTAHWLAVEGVQPSIPQNPSSADARNIELLPRGTGPNSNLAALNGNDNVTAKPHVKHILSKELQLYFEKVCTSVLDEAQEDYRVAGLASLKDDPGLQQLVPYFIQFVADKITHSLKELFILTQTMHVIEALARNKSLYVEPYVGAIVPSVLTCLIGKHLGTTTDGLDHFDLRDLAASLLGLYSRRYSKASHTLKPRLARSCLKNFLDPNKPFGTHYGAILGLHAIGGPEVVRQLILPNIKEFESIIKEEIVDNGPRRAEAEKVLAALMSVLSSLQVESLPTMNGHSEEAIDELRGRLVEQLGDLVGNRVADSGQLQLAHAILGDQASS